MSFKLSFYLILLCIVIAGISCSVPPAVLSAKYTTQPVMIGPVPHISATEGDIQAQRRLHDEHGKVLVEIENSDYQVISVTTRRTTSPSVTDRELALEETKTGVNKSRIAIEKIKVTSWTPHHIGGVIPWVSETGEVCRMKAKGWVYPFKPVKNKTTDAQEKNK